MKQYLKMTWKKSHLICGFRILLATVLFVAGLMKIAGLGPTVRVFQQIGFGAWFRYTTGLLEVTAAALLISPRFYLVGSVIASCTMMGAICAHIFFIGGGLAFPSALLVIGITILSLGYSSS